MQPRGRWRRARVRARDGARIRAVAARARPRRAGGGAVPRRGRAGAPQPAQALCDRNRARGRARSPLLAVLLAYDRRIAEIFVGSAALVFVGLRLVATLVMALARRAPRPRSTVLRLAIANIHRPGALTPTVVLSLGLGLAVLVTVTLIEGNLRHQLNAALPERAPSFYFVDIQSRRRRAVRRLRAPACARRHARSRADAARPHRVREGREGRRAEGASRTPPGCCRATAASPMRARCRPARAWSRANGGRPDQTGPPLVSLEKRIADGLGLAVGDEIVVNVLGRNVTARIANLRTLDWQSLGINFVLVFSPATFRGAPHTELATLTYPGGAPNAEEVALLKAVAAGLPGDHHVRVEGSPGGGRRHRVEARRSASAPPASSPSWPRSWCWRARSRPATAIASTMRWCSRRSARRVGRLLAAYALEYLLLGAGDRCVRRGGRRDRRLSHRHRGDGVPFRLAARTGAARRAAALALTLLFGLAGTFTALGQKPAPVLRNL